MDRQISKEARAELLEAFMAKQPVSAFTNGPPPDQDAVGVGVVGACHGCSASFSLGEQDLACLLDCAICGGAETVGMHRPDVKRIPEEHRALRYRIETARNEMQRITCLGSRKPAGFGTWS